MPKQTPLQTLEDAIAIAFSNGWTKGDLGLIFTLYSLPELLRHNRFYMIIFDHGFAKTLWGEDEVVVAAQNFGTLTRTHQGLPVKKPEPQGLESLLMPLWKFRLQRMAVAEDPLKYLEQNLPV